MDSFANKIKKMEKTRSQNIKRFRREFPQFKQLTNKQVLIIFKMYKQNCSRTYFASNVSLLVAGTLVILFTSLFMNAGAAMEISNDDVSANQIVMNTIIASASSGLFITISNQFSNLISDDQIIQER